MTIAFILKSLSGLRQNGGFHEFVLRIPMTYVIQPGSQPVYTALEYFCVASPDLGTFIFFDFPCDGEAAEHVFIVVSFISSAIHHRQPFLAIV
jgi:hypothetical protein